jgi:PEP-CTERM motif
VGVVKPPSEPVPEPLTILGSLAAAGVGAALRRKYQQQQEDTAKV